MTLYPDRLGQVMHACWVRKRTEIWWGRAWFLRPQFWCSMLEWNVAEIHEKNRIVLCSRFHRTRVWFRRASLIAPAFSTTSSSLNSFLKPCAPRTSHAPILGLWPPFPPHILCSRAERRARCSDRAFSSRNGV